jgi:hypothetical protein
MQSIITEESPVAKHLIGVSGSTWAFWRCVCLRSAGFPFDGVFKLAASPDLISAADEVTEAIRAVKRARTRARQEVNSTLDDLWSSGSWDDKKTRKALLKARSVISAQEIPRSLPETVKLNSIGELKAAVRHLGTARTR